MILIASREEKELLERLRRLDTKERAGVLTEEIVTLKRQISDLEISKSRKEEDFAKQERELRHMIGLEKKRQEVEIEQTKKETALTIREGNLASEKARFEEHLKFNTERFQSMETYLKEMMTSILARLPNVTMAIEQKGRR